MDRFRTFLLATALASSSLIGPASATPITLGPVSLVRAEVAANDIGLVTGDRISIIDDVVQPNSAGGTTGTATTVNSSTGLSVTEPLGNNPRDTVFFDQFSHNIAYDSGLVQPWTLTFTNGGNAATTTTPSLVGVMPIPFASSVTISGSSANPTFSWVYPGAASPTGSSVNGTIINIFEHLPGGGIDAVYATGLRGTINSFTVPTALAGGLSLINGTLYTMDIVGVQLRNTALPISNPNSQAWSRAFFDFTPLPSGSPVVNLPTVTASGAYQYHLTVVAGQTIFVDPTVAVGYSFAIGAGDPNFASVIFPAVQTAPFDLSFFYNGTEFSDMVSPQTLFDFPTGGVGAFTLTGIDPADGLDPADTTAFITGLTFEGDGTFTGTQTPITADVAVAPEPGSLALLVSGLLGWRLLRRRIRTVSPSSCAIRGCGAGSDFRTGALRRGRGGIRALSGSTIWPVCRRRRSALRAGPSAALGSGAP